MMNIFRVSTIAAAVAIIAACSSSPPKPAMPDGNSRVPANDPARVQALQESVTHDRALLSENNLLKVQVNVLQQKLLEMVSIVREAVLLPAAAPQAPVTPPARLIPAPTQPTDGALAPTEDRKLSKYAYSTNANGVVIRVFYDVSRTAFLPPPEIAQALREAARAADTIQVRGRTDSARPNTVNRKIAAQRALNAKCWLISNGISPDKITVWYSSSGLFIADNSTGEGRALNRRVEIDMQRAQPSSS